MTDKPDLDELARLQKDCGIPHLPTPLTYDLRRAISGEGPRAYDWRDKPHRLVFDACREIEALRGEVADLKASVIAFAGPAAAELAKAHGFPDGHLHPQHYDLLERCGARMDSFARAALGEDRK